MRLALVSESEKNSSDRQAFSAYLTDSESAETVKQVVEERAWNKDQVHSGDMAEAIRSLSLMPSPEILIIDLSNSLHVSDDMDALAEVCQPGTTVIALGTVNDVAFYRDLIASGIQDYLVKPVSVTVLKDAIHCAVSAREMPVDTIESAAKSRRNVAFVGVRGGVGTSLIVTSCAHILSKTMGCTVALLDLDFEFGTTSLIFDLEPGRGLKEALENPGRLDDLFIKRAIVKQNDNLSVLGAENAIAEPLQADPQALNQLIHVLDEQYEIVVIDTPKVMICSNPELLNLLDDLILVTDLTLAAARDTIRLLAFIKKHTKNIRITLVVNKDGLSSAGEVDPKDFEASIERPIDILIPYEAKGTVIAAKRGQALAEAKPKVKASLRIADLAQRLAGLPEKAKTKKASFWATFGGRKNK